jgi:hypothetical protein
MNQSDRLLQEIDEFELEWKNLTKRIKAVRQDHSLAEGGERRVILEEQLAALTDERTRLRYQLDALEQELNGLTVQPGPKRAFISYKRDADQDHSLALYLDRFLNDRRIETFIDQKLKVGMAWVEEIYDQIAHSDFLIVLLSPASMGSDMVLEEVKFADQQRRQTGLPRILPIRLAFVGALPYELEQYIQPLQYLLWRNTADNADTAWRIYKRHCRPTSAA